MTHPLATEPTPKAARETLAYIDMCLALPMCQNAISEYGQGVVETFQAVRKLLLGGMHPDMRARLEAALSTHTNDRTE